MAIKHRNAVAKADFEDALDYLGLSVSEVAKRTGIPRAYLSDLKNRNVRLRREHEDKLRAHLEDEGVEFEEPGDADQVRPPAPPPPHPSVETAVVLRRSLSLADSLEDDQIAEALDAQADRDARLSELLRQKIAREEVLLGLAPSKYTDEFKASVEEARRLLAESYFLIGVLRGLRGFTPTAGDAEPETLGELLAQEQAAALEAAGLAPTETDPLDPESAQAPRKAVDWP